MKNPEENGILGNFSVTNLISTCPGLPGQGAELVKQLLYSGLGLVTLLIYLLLLLPAPYAATKKRILFTLLTLFSF